MSEIVYGDPTIDGWVATNLGLRKWADSYSIANVKDRFILGASVLHNWYPETGIVEITSFSESPRWMSRKMINAVFGYAFDTLKCQMVVLRVSEINTRMINIAKGLGFEGYLIPRLRGKNEAEWIFCLTDDDWARSPYRRK
ncbi:MAG TPA: GNAT family N-acetyltransferase [Anaerolineales bacterium]|nr:GNAT family N-acetyltransferase [Anaerolineales bacterium]